MYVSAMRERVGPELSQRGRQLDCVECTRKRSDPLRKWVSRELYLCPLTTKALVVKEGILGGRLLQWVGVTRASDTPPVSSCGGL